MTLDTTEMLAKFWPKVDRTGDCWIWRWSRFRTNDYGHWLINGKHHLAHRFAYEALVGPIPPGHDLDHLCRVKACCNPAHLEPVTRSENLRRGVGPRLTRARQAAKTHCPQGHEYTPENTRQIRGKKGRLCRECGRQECRARRKAARMAQDAVTGAATHLRASVSR